MNAGCREKSLTVLAAILFNSAGCDSNVKRDGPRYAITASEVAKQDFGRRLGGVLGTGVLGTEHKS